MFLKWWPRWEELSRNDKCFYTCSRNLQKGAFDNWLCSFITKITGFHLWIKLLLLMNVRLFLNLLHVLWMYVQLNTLCYIYMYTHCFFLWISQWVTRLWFTKSDLQTEVDVSSWVSSLIWWSCGYLYCDKTLRIKLLYFIMQCYMVKRFCQRQPFFIDQMKWRKH